MIVLVRNRDGAYVSRQGSEHSYTRRLDDARTWQTLAQAEAEMWRDSEHAESVEIIMQGQGEFRR
jgi:hypothetical protein